MRKNLGKIAQKKKGAKEQRDKEKLTTKDTAVRHPVEKNTKKKRKKNWPQKADCFYVVIVALIVSDHGPFWPPLFTHRSI